MRGWRSHRPARWAESVREDERARAPLRTQAEVDPEDVPLLGDRLQDPHDAPHRLGEELPVGDAARLAAPRFATSSPTVVSVHEDRVDVRGVVQLATAE